MPKLKGNCQCPTEKYKYKLYTMVSSKNQWLGGDDADADLDFDEGEDSVNALEDPFVPSEIALSGEPVEYEETEDADPVDTQGSMGGRRLITAVKPKKTRKTRKGKKSKRKTSKSKKRKSSKKPKKSRKSRKSRRSRRSRRRSRGGRMWANLSRAGESTNAGMGLYKADAAGVIKPVAVTPVYNVKHI